MEKVNFKWEEGPLISPFPTPLLLWAPPGFRGNFVGKAVGKEAEEAGPLPSMPGRAADKYYGPIPCTPPCLPPYLGRR